MILRYFLVVLKSPNIIITKSYSCKKSLSTGKVDKETMKSKISVVEGKNRPTVFHKIFDINLRS